MAKKSIDSEKAKRDLENRLLAFNGRLVPLLKEFKLGLASQAFLTEDGRIASRPVMVDDSQEKVEPQKDEIIVEK